MSDKTAKMLERVRALLAKAASTSFPAEAETFRQKADELMTTYAIEQWMVEQAESDRSSRPEPQRRDMDFGWWRTNPFRQDLWTLFNAVARHCRCGVVAKHVDYIGLKIPVFGVRSDLDWFDMLFTNLMLQMMQKIDPEPRHDLDRNENLAMFREAGVKWELAINKMLNAGMGEEGDTFDSVYKPWVHGYRRWCRATGHDQSYVNQNTFRKHFAAGFASEIETRLWRMSQESERVYDEGHAAGSMALAVRDIKAVVKEAMYAEFPDLRPHPADCDCDQCHFCSDPACQRCKKYRQVRRYRAPAAEKIDHAGREAGRVAAKAANISNSPSDRIGNRRNLPS